MKSICFVVYDLTVVGGVERVVEGLANRLTEDYLVHVVSIHGYKTNPALQFADTVRVSFLNIEKTRLRTQMRKGSWKLKKYFKQNRIDVAFLEATYVGFIGAPLRFISRTKLVFCDHGALLNQYDEKDVRNMRRIASVLCHKTVVLTEKSRQDYEALFKTKRAKIEVIYNWISNEMLQDANEYKIDSKVIVSAGRYTKEKGYDLLIQVAKRIKAECATWTWEIYGEGPLEQELQKEIIANGLEEFVKLNRFTVAMRDVYKRASLFVLTSYREGIPLVLLEAKAYRIPCVSFDIVTGPNEIIEDKINGVLIEPFDVEAMARELLALVKQPELRKRFSDEAYANIEKFSEEQVLQLWKDLITRTTGV